MTRSLSSQPVAAAVAHATGVGTVVAPKKYKNCAALNKVYKHGVAKKKGVKDKTSGVPVRNDVVSLRVYDLNCKALERDKDGIDCEKHWVEASGSTRASPALRRPPRPMSMAPRVPPSGFGPSDERYEEAYCRRCLEG